MLRRKRAPNKSFMHSDDCRVFAADPTVSIPWSAIGGGHWQAVCQCGVQDFYEPVVDRVRLDPLDAKTSRHAPQCEFANETDPAVLRVLLKAQDGSGGDYWWVTCGAGDTAWPVPFYAQASVE
jgi:hypothetical protein